MIKQFSRICAALVLVGFSTVAFAQGSIAVVDVQAAMINSDYAQELLKSKSEDPEVAKLNSTFQALRADLQAMAAEAQANSATWTAEQATEHNKQMQYKNADLQLAAQKIEAEQQEVFVQIQNDLAEEATAAIEGLIQTEGVTLLLDRTTALYVDPSLDLTAKLVAKLNETPAE